MSKRPSSPFRVPFADPARLVTSENPVRGPGAAIALRTSNARTSARDMRDAASSSLTVVQRTTSSSSISGTSNLARSAPVPRSNARTSSRRMGRSLNPWDPSGSRSHAQNAECHRSRSSVPRIRNRLVLLCDAESRTNAGSDSNASRARAKSPTGGRSDIGFDYRIRLATAMRILPGAPSTTRVARSPAAPPASRTPSPGPAPPSTDARRVRRAPGAGRGRRAARRRSRAGNRLGDRR